MNKVHRLGYFSKLRAGNWQEVKFILFSYLFLGLLYWVGFLLQNRLEVVRSVEFMKSYVFRVILIQPFYFLMFYWFAFVDIARKVILNIVFCTVFVCIWVIGVKLIRTEWLSEFEVFGNSFYFDTALMYIFLFGAFHTYEYFVLFKQHQTSEKQLLQLNFESEKSILTAQMQPHFLFNILNSITASIPFQLESTRESIAPLAQTYRYILNASKIDSVLLKDELIFFKEYLRLENQRFENMMAFDFSAEPAVLKRMIPPMFLHATLYHLIEFLRGRWKDEINFFIYITSLGQVLKFEVTINLPEELDACGFQQLLQLTAPVKENSYLQQCILKQLSPYELFIVFLIKNNA